MEKNNVFIYKSPNSLYPNNPPFHPGNNYPEYIFSDISKEENFIYDSFRNLLKLMGFDRLNQNTKKWNPFKHIVSPGDQVFIKPNLVMDDEKYQNCLTTHPALIRVIIDYVVYALKGQGKIYIGDAPLQDCNFQTLVKNTGLGDVIKFFQLKNVDITLIDIRCERLEFGFKLEKKKVRLNGDKEGYYLINLKTESNLQEISLNNGYKKFRVTKYDPITMKTAHNQINHKYLISKSLLQSDVVINVPKLKTHRKAGITGCLKNTIGINGKKDMLPHHRKGALNRGGDEYLKSNLFKALDTLLSELKDQFLMKNMFLHKIFYYPIYLFKILLNYILDLLGENVFFEGSWYGNDTLWRTIADLNQILFYIDKNGQLSKKVQRRLLYICDGIICGENEGPLEPTPRKTGILVAGYDPLLIDLTIAELFSYDYRKIPQIFNLFQLSERKITAYKPNDLEIISNNSNWDKKGLNGLIETLKINPPKGWENHIEKIINNKT